MGFLKHTLLGSKSLIKTFQKRFQACKKGFLYVSLELIQLYLWKIYTV